VIDEAFVALNSIDFDELLYLDIVAEIELVLVPAAVTGVNNEAVMSSIAVTLVSVSVPVDLIVLVVIVGVVIVGVIVPVLVTVNDELLVLDFVAELDF
jgi:hypothetical protein